MHIATLLHNPKAGDRSYSKEDLKSMIESEGIKCLYSSVKKEGWENIDNQTEFLIVAGGDGTVRKVARKLLATDLNNKYPLALFPAGTANNIAKTLDVPEGDDKEVISRWKNMNRKRFDVGKVSNVPSAGFFLESFGFGVFPMLMQEMKKQDKRLKDTPEKKLQLALELLEQIAQTFRPEHCEIKIDGTLHAGKFLMAEIMNTQSIGPNLVLSPFADPADGEFEVVLIPESQRDKLVDYISAKISGEEHSDWFDTYKARQLEIHCKQFVAHVDDEIVEVHDIPTVEVQLRAGLLEFLV